MIRELCFQATKSSGEVSAILNHPENATWLLVLGHGAGAGMHHPFMESIANSLAERGIATFRYQFPYMQRGSRRPDPSPILMATVRSAIEAASETSGTLPFLAGGKSLGGRMTSMAAARAPLPHVRGLVFLGFPLHSAGKPATERSLHLANVTIPMLFLQGTRDKLADLSLLRPVCQNLRPRVTLQIVEGADHSFNLPKSASLAMPVSTQLAAAVSDWTSTLDDTE